MANVFLKECNVKKTNQYDALKVWNLLEISKQLYLFNEDKKECVSLYYKVTNEDKEKEEDDDAFNERFPIKVFKIGNLSEEDATPIDKFLKARQTSDINEHYEDDLFECLICKCDKTADEDKRFSVAIFIKK